MTKKQQVRQLEMDIEASRASLIDLVNKHFDVFKGQLARLSDSDPEARYNQSKREDWSDWQGN